MIRFRRADPMREMVTLLAEEREALLSGALGKLPDLLRRKEALLARLQAGPAPDEAALAALRDKAQTNLALLQAAGEGIAAGQKRLAQMRDSMKGWRSYDSTGERSAVGSTPGRLEHKV